MENLIGGRRRRRLVLIASPLQGHMTSMLQLAIALHSKGFSITIPHSDLNSPNPSNHPDFIFVPLSDNLSAIDASKGLTPTTLGALNNNCIPGFKQHLAKMIQQDGENITVIHDNLMYFAGDVAADLNIPSIVFRSTSASYLPAFLLIPHLHQQGRFPVHDSMLQELLPELHPLRYKDLPFINSPIQDALQILALSARMRKNSAIIWNTVNYLEQPALSQIQQHYEVPVLAIGPLHEIAPGSSTSFLEEDISCIEWLDKQAPKSVIYVSVGSLARVDEKEVAEIAWGLANSDQPFLWVVRPGSVRGSDWIEFLPKAFKEEIRGRGLIVKWAPQKRVLAHVAVGGFWSHCGWNSTLESLSEGVPMICRPFLIDQGVNARYVTYVWKVGLELEHLERGMIEYVIRRLLVDKEGEEIRNRASEIKEKVKAAVCEGGSSDKNLNYLVESILSS